MSVYEFQYVVVKYVMLLVAFRSDRASLRKMTNNRITENRKD